MVNANITCRIAVLSFLWLLGSCALVSGQADRESGDSSTDKRWKLVWSDEFNDDGAIDSDRWDFERGFIRNEELQYYTNRPSNARVEDGCLVIEAHRERLKNADHEADHRRWQKKRPVG